MSGLFNFAFTLQLTWNTKLNSRIWKVFAICDGLFLFPLLDVTSSTPVTAAGHFLAVTRDGKISEGRGRMYTGYRREKEVIAKWKKKTPCKTNTYKGPFAKSYFYKNNFKVHSSTWIEFSDHLLTGQPRSHMVCHSLHQRKRTLFKVYLKSIH